MKSLQLYCIALLALLFTAGYAHAVSTSVGVQVSRGNSHSMVYSLNLAQRYEPWLDTSLFSLAPLAELGGHAWVPDDSDADTVWGAYLAPGLRFTLFTDAPIRPYLEGSVGGAINNKKKLDNRDLGSNALFRTRGSVGISFGDGFRHRIQGDYVHYSTWGISNRDDGYSTYGISYGFSF